MLCTEQKKEKGGLTLDLTRPGCRGRRELVHTGTAMRDVTVVSAHNSSVAKQELSPSRAFTSAKTQLNHLKRNLPGADSKNVLTFSGKCWCCHCKAVLFCPLCRGACWHCPRAAGPGLRLLWPPRQSQQALCVLSASSLLSTCLHDTTELMSPGVCPIRLFLSCLSLLLASQRAPKII